MLMTIVVAIEICKTWAHALGALGALDLLCYIGVYAVTKR